MAMADGVFEYWCQECVDALLECGNCKKGFCPEDVKDYWNFTSGETLILCDACAEWIKVTLGNDLVPVESEEDLAHAL